MNSIIKDRIDKIGQGIVPEGYKKTKIGIIPEDWEVKKLGKLAEINMGQSPKSENYNIDGVGLPLIQGNADMKLGITNPKQYTSEITKTCDIGDIIMSVRAPVGALAISNHKACIGRGVCSIKANKYVYYYLIKNNNDLKKYSQGSTFEAINGSDIKSLLIRNPSESEQEKIADALSTWDNAIENIEKLIKEKETQKKGLMQQLLTGETRLPGFNDEWNEVKLGEISNYISSGITKNKVDYGRYVVYGSMGVIGYSSDYDYEGIKILIARVGENAGTINIVDGKYGVSDNTIVVDIKLDFINYIYYYLKLFNINKLVFGTGQPLIKGSDVKEIKVILPPLVEQKAIAEILSTADKEIELLKQLLENKKEEKKGLMQLLLTGIVRV